MIWTEQVPNMGDMIRVKVKFYHHYGIYLDEEHIVQFGLPDNTGLDPNEIAVVVTDMEGFLAGGDLEVAKLTPMERLRRYSPKKTKALALSRVGETGYNILHNNCEHFVNECVFGRHESSCVAGVRTEIRNKCEK